VCLCEVLVASLCAAAARLDGTMVLRCKGNGQPFTFVTLSLGNDETVSFEFMNAATWLDKRADVSAERCIRGSCVSGKGTVQFAKFVWNRGVSGTLKIDFPGGDRINAGFRAIARPKITGHCE
jgi:hypothetical protein